MFVSATGHSNLKQLQTHEPSAARKEGRGISKHFNEFSGTELGVGEWVGEQKRC